MPATASRRPQARGPADPDPAPRGDRRAGRLGEPVPGARPGALPGHACATSWRTSRRSGTSTTPTRAPAASRPTRATASTWTRLMGPSPLAAGEAQAIDASCARADASAAQTMERASHLLSRLSRHVGFVLAPDIARTSFRHIDLVPLGHPRVLVVMVSATGLVTHKVIEVEERLDAGRAPGLRQLPERPLHAACRSPQIRARLLELMSEEKALYDSLLQRVIGARRARLRGRGRRGQRLPRRHLEHPGAARVRRHRAHARALPDLRGEEPAGADPERLHRRRGHPRADRPREPRPGAAGPVARRRDLPARRRARLRRRRPGLDAHGVRARRLARRPRGARGLRRRCGESRREPARQRTTRTTPRRRPAAGGRAEDEDAPRRPSSRTRPDARAARRRGRAATRCAASATSSRTRCCAGAPTSRTTGSASSATASTAAVEAEAGVLRQLLGTVDNLERALAAAGRGDGAARGRGADPPRAAGAARVAGRRGDRPARRSASTRPRTRRSCTSRRRASSRARWPRCSARASATGTACCGRRW